MNIQSISKDEQENILDSFWTMLCECENKAIENNDNLLKCLVEDWYNQWNRVTGDNKSPIWYDYSK
jgi:hypothetical protein